MTYFWMLYSPRWLFFLQISTFGADHVHCKFFFFGFYSVALKLSASLVTFFNSPCELLEGVTYRLPGLKNIRKRKKKKYRMLYSRRDGKEKKKSHCHCKKKETTVFCEMRDGLDGFAR